MQYLSTRGHVPATGFQQTILTGLAADGGLLVPKDIPQVAERLEAWSKLSYADLAYEVLSLFADIPEGDLRRMIAQSYQAFRRPDVAPMVTVGDLHILELFHGPTLAFKDIALQLLGNLFEYALKRTGRKMNILAATSGDTGSAAIYGVRGREHIQIFVMHPEGRISSTQERQMTSVLDQNVFNIAIRGSFDDCQNIMKSIFRDVGFKERMSLGAVNSVNWARILAQIVYYFYGGLKLMREKGSSSVQFAVPTGNFGNIMAGFYARQMGLPIKRLILATNENDILARFFNTGVYERGSVVQTVSPSMDIQVASNFERYLYYKVGKDSRLLSEMMQRFEAGGAITCPLREGAVDPLFVAGCGSTGEVCSAIARYYKQYNYLLDPHTAVGVVVAERYIAEEAPVLCLATAHPAKFPETIKRAVGQDVARHEMLDKLAGAPTRCVVLPAEEKAVREYLVQHIT